MITLDKISDLPKLYIYREIDGEIPQDLEADYFFITPTLKVKKYFIIVKEIIGVDR